MRLVRAGSTMRISPPRRGARGVPLFRAPKGEIRWDFSVCRVARENELRRYEKRCEPLEDRGCRSRCLAVRREHAFAPVRNRRIRHVSSRSRMQQGFVRPRGDGSSAARREHPTHRSVTGPPCTLTSRCDVHIAHSGCPGSGPLADVHRSGGGPCCSDRSGLAITWQTDSLQQP